MDDNSYTTSGGITVHRTAVPCDPRALADLTVNVEQRRGGVLSSGMEYPGRYSRWHLGYVDPCLEVVASGRTIGATALNDRGRVLLPAVARALAAHGAVVEHTDDTVAVTVPEPDPTEFFTEEERSRRPSVFSALRALVGVFFHAEEPAPGPVRGVRLRPGVPVRAGAAQARPPARPSGTWCCTCRTRSGPGPQTRGGGQVLLRLRGGRGVHGRAQPGNRTAPAGPRRYPARSGSEICLPQPRPGRYAQVVEDAKERFARGDLFEVVPSHVFYAPVRVAGRVLRAAAPAQPGPVRVPVQPGRGGVPGRRLARDVRAGHAGTGWRPARSPARSRAARTPSEDAANIAHPARLGQGGVRADHVHRRGPQRQVAGLRAGLGPGDRPPADRDVQPPHPHRRPHRGPAAGPGSTRSTRSSPTCGRSP